MQSATAVSLASQRIIHVPVVLIFVLQIALHATDKLGDKYLAASKVSWLIVELELEFES